MRCAHCSCELSEDSVVLAFDSGRSWLVAERVLHYYACHNWSPPADLLEDVMTRRLVRLNPQIHSYPVCVGFITEGQSYFLAPPVDGFFTRLWGLTLLACQMNQQVTRKEYQRFSRRCRRAVRAVMRAILPEVAARGVVAMLSALFMPRHW